MGPFRVLGRGLGTGGKKGGRMKTRLIAFAAALAAALAPLAPARAQDGVPPIDPYTIGQERVQQSMRINVDVEDVDLADVMEQIGRQVGKNILVDPNVHETVRVSLRDIGWREAVEVIAKMTRCEVEEREGGILLLTQPPKVTIQFTEANIRTVLQLLAAYSGKNIIISQEVQGRVTLDLKDVHWNKALHAIVKTAGDYEVVEDGEDLIRVVDRSSIQQQLSTVVMRLKYVRPPAIYRAVPPASAPGTQGGGSANASTVFVGRLNNTAAGTVGETFTLFRSLQLVLQASGTPGSALEYDEQTNSFIVTATQPLLNQLAAIIDKVDREPAQVFAEVKFVATRDNNLQNRGIEFNEGNAERGLRWANTEHGPFPDNRQLQVLLPPTSPGGAPQVSPEIVNVGEFPFRIGEGVGAFSRAFNLPAILDFEAFDVAINLIDRDDRSRVIQSPSLFMLDNQDAVIFVGDQVPYATLRSQPDANGNVVQTLEEGDRSPVAIGFSLFIQPHVVPNSERIALTVIPRVNDLVGTTSAIPGFERFAFGGNLELNLPRTREQALVTHIMLDDTSTAVLGGLLTEIDTEIIKRVPILSSLPIIGNLFTNTRENKRLENLTIFVTPTIIRQRRTQESIFIRATRRLEETDYFYKKYERPPVEEKD